MHAIKSKHLATSLRLSRKSEAAALKKADVVLKMFSFSIDTTATHAQCFRTVRNVTGTRRRMCVDELLKATRRTPYFKGTNASTTMQQFFTSSHSRSLVRTLMWAPTPRPTYKQNIAPLGQHVGRPGSREN